MPSYIVTYRRLPKTPEKGCRNTSALFRVRIDAADAAEATRRAAELTPDDAFDWAIVHPRAKPTPPPRKP